MSKMNSTYNANVGTMIMQSTYTKCKTFKPTIAESPKKAKEEGRIAFVLMMDSEMLRKGGKK